LHNVDCLTTARNPSRCNKLQGSFDSLAVSTISLARATNQTWPFVTLPDFAVRMAKILPLSRTFVMYMLPLVTPSQRDEWEAYTVQNDYWVNESIKIQKEFQNYYGPTEYDTESYGTIHGDFADIPANERYLWWAAASSDQVIFFQRRSSLTRSCDSVNLSSAGCFSHRGKTFQLFPM
jgi:hypothetical protein